jgi:hypothetical protein
MYDPDYPIIKKSKLSIIKGNFKSIALSFVAFILHLVMFVFNIAECHYICATIHFICYSEVLVILTLIIQSVVKDYEYYID